MLEEMKTEVSSGGRIGDGLVNGSCAGHLSGSDGGKKQVLMVHLDDGKERWKWSDWVLTRKTLLCSVLYAHLIVANLMHTVLVHDMYAPAHCPRVRYSVRGWPLRSTMV
jgi:hypothetical protein